MLEILSNLLLGLFLRYWYAWLALAAIGLEELWRRRRVRRARERLGRQPWS